MTDKVGITIKGIRTMDGEHECVEESGDGDYYRKNGKHYILWRRDGDMVKRIRIDDHSMTVTETNGGNAMDFQEGRKTTVAYGGPEGKLVLVLWTHRFRVRCREEVLEAEVEYALYYGENHISDNKITVTVFLREA